MARIVQKEAAMKLANSLTVLAGMTALLLVPTRAPAADPQVRDDAGFFDAATIGKADAVIRQIKQDHGKDLVVETFPSIPPGLSSQYDPQHKDAFFAEWAKQRATDLKLNGVEVLICKEPGRIEVQAGEETMKRAFTKANLDRMRDIILGGFRSKNYDPALLSAVDYAKQTFDQNMGSARSGGPAAGQSSGRSAGGGASNSPAPTPPTSTRFSPGCFTWVLIIGGGLLLLSFIRRRFSEGGGARGYGQPGYGGYGPGGYGGGGGGGFGRGILGGLLGGMLGGYMQDRWSHGQTPPPDAGAGGGGSDPGSAFPSDEGQGFSGTGGDFTGGGGGGGGDFGGGGGGDASGGSSGGDF